MEPVAVDHSRREDVHGHTLGAREHGEVELLARRLVDLLRVVQQGERPHAVVAQALVVEQHTGDDERPGERTTARLVRTGDEADAETAVEAEEPLPGTLARHLAEDSPGPRGSTVPALARCEEVTEAAHNRRGPGASEPRPVRARTRAGRCSRAESGGRGR